MRERALALAGSALESALSRRGLDAVDATLGREATRDWVAHRLSARRTGQDLLAGHRVVVPRAGRAELRPFELLSAGAGEVTVVVDRSAISPGTERAQWLRLPNARPALPHVPGYSGAGRVRGTDERVAVIRLPHASVATVPSAWAVPVPDAVPTDAAALVYLAVISGLGVDRAGPLDGRSLAVVGAGTIGALAHRLGRAAGAARTTVVARTRRSERAALAAGADAFRTVGDGAGDLAADVVIEATGDPSAVRLAVEACRPGGTVVLLGSPRGVSPDVPVAEVQRGRITLVGAHISSLAAEARRGGDVDGPFRDLAARYLDAVAAGMEVADLIGDAVDPREIALTYGRLARHEVDHAQLDWSRLPEIDRVGRRTLLDRPLLPDPSGTTVPAAPRAATTAPVSTLRMTLLGCGDIGLANGRAIRAAEGAELVRCHDVVPALADAAGDALGCDATTDLDAALDPGVTDAVVLAVPHHLHEPLALRAAAAGLHVVVEKPLGVDLGAAQRIAGAAEAAGVALTTCFPYRHEPHVRTAARLARSGALGPVRGFCIVFHADKPDSYWHGGFSGRSSSDWRQRPEQSGGGVLIMNLTHHVDLLRHVTGLEVVEVTAVLGDDGGTGIEERAMVLVRLAGGAIGTVTASATTRGTPEGRFEIWGDHGTIRLEPEPSVHSLRAVDGLAPGRWHRLEGEGQVDSRAEFMAAFAAAVASGQAPAVSARDGVAVHAVIEAAYRSAAGGGHPVDVTAIVGEEP